MSTPPDILNEALGRARSHLESPLIANQAVVERIETICRYLPNRACTRFILACTLAKVHRPNVDIRKPYTEIHQSDVYSGRTYDERYLTSFIRENDLPCNSTTAFLMPAFRNRNVILTPDVEMVGRPKPLYVATLQLLTDVQGGAITASDLLAETIRLLLIIREEQRQRLSTLLTGMKSTGETAPLSAEAIVTFVEQHLKIRGSSQLPVLIVAAAYRAASARLGEKIRPLQAHNAADEQTGALGDLEIALIDDGDALTIYEMKTREVSRNDIDQAMEKVSKTVQPVEHYFFITTFPIEKTVKEYAASQYDLTNGIEVVVLDCIGFLRHFLHLFHRLRGEFLDIYQEFVLSEPDSAVNQPIKEAFLVLRRAAESNVDADSP